MSYCGMFSTWSASSGRACGSGSAGPHPAPCYNRWRRGQPVSSQKVLRRSAFEFSPRCLGIFVPGETGGTDPLVGVVGLCQTDHHAVTPGNAHTPHTDIVGVSVHRRPDSGQRGEAGCSSSAFPILFFIDHSPLCSF